MNTIINLKLKLVLESCKGREGGHFPLLSLLSKDLEKFLKKMVSTPGINGEVLGYLKVEIDRRIKVGQSSCVLNAHVWSEKKQEPS